MSSILKSLRLAADPARLRLLLLLEQEELSVAELQEILSKGQSRISTHLAQLKQAGLVDDRRTGKNAFYRLKAPAELMELLRKAAAEIPRRWKTGQALRLACASARTNAPLLRRTGGQIRPPIRARALVERHRRSAHPADAADDHRGFGRRRWHDFAIDGRAREEGNCHRQLREKCGSGRKLAKKHGISNLEYRWAIWKTCRSARHGGPGIFEPGAAPCAGIRARFGRGLAYLETRRPHRYSDLNRHNFEEAREMYADLWLGFTELEMER